MNIKKLNTTALAYMGDAVYEMYVRRHLFLQGHINPDKLHKQAVKYVNAEAQAMVVRALFEGLDPAEQVLVKRARNRKSTSKPKNADPVVYKWATAFEALVGYLYLSAMQDRLDEVIAQAIAVINDGECHVKEAETNQK